MDRTQLSVMGGLCVLGAATAVTVQQIAALGGKLERVFATTQVRPTLQTRTVTGSPSALVTVCSSTIRNDGESVADFYTRHKAVVTYTKTH